MNKTCIYALVDPRDLNVRYVGKANNPHERFTAHMSDKEGYTPKQNWIFTLWVLRMQPVLRIVEIVPSEEGFKAERRWIEHYRKKGAPLTNTFHRRMPTHFHRWPIYQVLVDTHAPIHTMLMSFPLHSLRPYDLED